MFWIHHGGTEEDIFISLRELCVSNESHLQWDEWAVNQNSVGS